MDSSDVLAEVLGANKDVSAVRVVRFSVLPPGDERAPLEEASKVAVAKAKQLRASLKLPFWDMAMFASSESPAATEGIFAAALFHNAPKRPTLIARSEATAERLRREFLNISESEIVAALSRVEMSNGTISHIPMIDFHVPGSNEAERAVCAVVSKLHLRGFVLSSGKSYHFIGLDIFSEAAFPGFLGHALLFAPIVDRTWVAHQLIEGYCALRISPREHYGGPPRVVARLGT